MWRPSPSKGSTTGGYINIAYAINIISFQVCRFANNCMQPLLSNSTYYICVMFAFRNFRTEELLPLGDGVWQLQSTSGYLCCGKESTRERCIWKLDQRQSSDVTWTSVKPTHNNLGITKLSIYLWPHEPHWGGLMCWECHIPTVQLSIPSGSTRIWVGGEASYTSIIRNEWWLD